MERQQALDALGALAEETGLDAFRLLVQAEPDGLSARDLAARMDAVPGRISGQLGELATAGLVSRRGAGDATRYRAEIDAIRGLLAFLVEDCCTGSPELCAPAAQARPFDRMLAAGRRFNVLFLCTQNSARSILAEAIMNHDHGARFQAFSAGSQASGEVSGEVLALLERLGYPTEGLRSKSWDAFAGPEAPEMDFVFTVCDDAATEECPVWPGAPMSAHWGVPDPKAVTGDATARRLACLEAFRMLERRIGVFASLPFAALERSALKRRLEEIGGGREGLGGAA